MGKLRQALQFNVAQTLLSNIKGLYYNCVLTVKFPSVIACGLRLNPLNDLEVRMLPPVLDARVQLLVELYQIRKNGYSGGLLGSKGSVTGAVGQIVQADLSLPYTWHRAGIAHWWCVLSSLSCVMQHRGFNPPLRRNFSGRGDFSLGVDVGSDSIAPKLFWMRV